MLKKTIFSLIKLTCIWILLSTLNGLIAYTINIYLNKGSIKTTGHPRKILLIEHILDLAIPIFFILIAYYLISALIKLNIKASILLVFILSIIITFLFMGVSGGFYNLSALDKIRILLFCLITAMVPFIDIFLQKKTNHWFK